MTETEFQTIIQKLDRLDKDNQLLSEKIELYRTVSQEQINSIRSEVESNQKQIEAFQQANQQQIEAFQEANKQQIEAFQEANKQQLNVSLGVLVTAAAAILASVVLGMAN